MARGAQLSDIRTLFKGLVGEVIETNSPQDAFFNARLKAMQDELCASYSWPFLEDKWDKAIPAGTRWIAFPTSNIRGISSSINHEQHIKAFCLHQTKYHELIYGISTELMNIHDSAADERQDPIQHWAEDTNSGDSSNPDEFEVWPIPVTNQVVRFEGQRVPRSFTSDSHKAELDDLLIALFTAADHLATRDQKNALIMLRRANQKLIGCRAGIPTPLGTINLGSNQLSFPKQKLVKVAVA